MLALSNWDSKRAPGMNIESLLSALKKTGCTKLACEDYLWHPAGSEIPSTLEVKTKDFVVFVRSLGVYSGLNSKIRRRMGEDEIAFGMGPH